MSHNSIGVNLRVTAHSNQGGRKYMEDMFCVAYQPTPDEKDLLYAFFGIFDGHGGREAANFAKMHLMDSIVCQKNFWSDDDHLVVKSIREGFVSTHYAMWNEIDKWPKTSSGLPSTSGTTASVVFVRHGKLFIGHVGDSSIVLGVQERNADRWLAKQMTVDHKPENDSESARIERCGGKVMTKSGIHRVVWNRPKVGHKGPVRRSTAIDEIPFLAVARSLGDLWSYNSSKNEYIVSPVPDVSVIPIDVSRHRCLILGSDGLWNVVAPQEAVSLVQYAESNNGRYLSESRANFASSSTFMMKNLNDEKRAWINPSKQLVDKALEKWSYHELRADNTSVITVVIDPPGSMPAAQRSHFFRLSCRGKAHGLVTAPLKTGKEPGEVTRLHNAETTYVDADVIGNGPTLASSPESSSSIKLNSRKSKGSTTEPSSVEAYDAKETLSSSSNEETGDGSRLICLDKSIQIHEISSSSEEDHSGRSADARLKAESKNNQSISEKNPVNEERRQTRSMKTGCTTQTEETNRSKPVRINHVRSARKRMVASNKPDRIEGDLIKTQSQSGSDNNSQLRMRLRRGLPVVSTSSAPMIKRARMNEVSRSEESDKKVKSQLDLGSEHVKVTGSGGRQDRAYRNITSKCPRRKTAREKRTTSAASDLKIGSYEKRVLRSTIKNSLRATRNSNARPKK